MLNTGAISLQRLHRVTLENRKPEINSLYVMSGIRDPDVAKYALEGIQNEPDFEKVMETLKLYSQHRLFNGYFTERFFEHFGKFATVLLEKAGAHYYYYNSPGMYRNKPKCLETIAWAPEQEDQAEQAEQVEHHDWSDDGNHHEDFEEARRQLQDSMKEMFDKLGRTLNQVSV